MEFVACPDRIPVHDPPGSNGHLLASVQTVGQTATLPAASEVDRKALSFICTGFLLYIDLQLCTLYPVPVLLNGFRRKL